MIRGVTHFYSETGTEGGYWAVQDERWMHGPVDMCPWGELTPFTDGRKACPGMAIYWKDSDPPEEIGHWKYEGLHVLRNGDYLKIYMDTQRTQILWEGTVNLKHHKLFTEDAYGFWIHTDQEDVDRELWASFFLKEYPCEVINAELQFPNPPEVKE